MLLLFVAPVWGLELKMKGPKIPQWEGKRDGEACADGYSCPPVSGRMTREKHVGIVRGLSWLWTS
jgi:hypothetical protein